MQSRLTKTLRVVVGLCLCLLVAAIVVLPLAAPLIPVSPSHKIYEAERRHDVEGILRAINGTEEYWRQVNRLMAKGYTANEAVTEITQRNGIMKFDSAKLGLPSLGQSSRGFSVMVDINGKPYIFDQVDGLLVLVPEARSELQ